MDHIHIDRFPKWYYKFLSVTVRANMLSKHPASPLGQELIRFKDFRDRLLADTPDLDEECLADTLEGLTDLREMLAQVIRSALEDEALVAGLSTRLKDMQARRERFEMRAERKRHMALEVMIEADIDRLAEADFAAIVKNGVPTLTISAEDKIPAAYWRPQPPKLDKLGLLAALKSGTEIDGVELVPGQQQFSVRTK
jgi:hypothetical protein